MTSLIEDQKRKGYSYELNGWCFDIDSAPQNRDILGLTAEFYTKAGHLLAGGEPVIIKRCHIGLYGDQWITTRGSIYHPTCWTELPENCDLSLIKTPRIRKTKNEYGAL